MVAVSHRLRSVDSIWSWNASPSTPIGMDPTITYQPIRAAGCDRSDRLVRDRAQVPTIVTMSRRK